MKIDLKPTCPMNPKDIVGSSKLPLELVPDTAVAHMALAFLEGALKYGRYNWRVAGVRSSIYVAAARRHLARFWNGEDYDPNTGVSHLASVMACMAIILDAELVDKLEDDRPPAASIGVLLDGGAEIAKNLKEKFKDHSPRQWTIADSEGTGDAWEPIEDAPPANEKLKELVRRPAPWEPSTGDHPGCWGPPIGDADLEMAWGKKARPDFKDPTDEAYEAAVAVTKTYSASPSAGVTLGPYSTQEALDKALWRWTEYREVLGETEDQRQTRLRREQAQ